jgi:DNA-binding MarR family transcriptional regulator
MPIINRREATSLFARLHELHDIGLEVRHLDALSKIDEQPRISITEIARAVGVSQPTMSRWVAAWEKKGLVRKTQDGKEQRVNFTPHGKAWFNTIVGAK